MVWTGKSMHILLVHQYFLEGGAESGGGSRWNQMSRYFAERGHRLTVLAGTVHYATGRKLPQYKRRVLVKEHECPGVTVYRCYVSESYNTSYLGRFWGYLSFVISAVYASLRVRRPDVMICTSPPLTVGLIGWAIRRRFPKLPMLFEVRDLWPESAIDTGVLTNKHLISLGYALERLSYHESTWINVLTPAFYDVLLERKNARKDRLSMLPNAADLDVFQPGPRANWVREKYDIGERFLVIYTGGLGVANHVIQFVEAAAAFNDDSARFMVIGDGMQREMLEQKARASGLNNVIFTGFRPKREVVDMCAAADVGCAVLKKVETFKTVYPNKVFDYMASARPTVVAIDGVARKLVEDAQCGMFVEPENAGQLATALKKLQGDPELRRRMGDNGYRYVREHFDRKKIAERYVKMLEQDVLTHADVCAVTS
jgi:glycosyltransferase involved in cell wall biosynthesis